MSPLLGADGETYAIAQGNIVVGGLGVEGADNSSLTVNIPTVGRIPRGASVEKLVQTAFLDTDFVILNLHQGDFSTAFNISETINETFGEGMATPLDKNSIRVRAPSDPNQKVGYAGRRCARLTISHRERRHECRPGRCFGRGRWSECKCRSRGSKPRH